MNIYKVTFKFSTGAVENLWISVDNIVDYFVDNHGKGHHSLLYKKVNKNSIIEYIVKYSHKFTDINHVFGNFLSTSKKK